MTDYVERRIESALPTKEEKELLDKALEEEKMEP